MNNEINNSNNKLSPVNVNANLDVSADITNSVDKVVDSTLEAVNPPVKKSSEIVTGLLSFISESIDTGLYIYKENLKYYKAKCHEKIKSKIDAIPKENLTTPDVGIIGETMEKLKYNLDKDYLVELYSNIIAKDVDSRTKDRVHPSFISIIKDLSYDDIKFLEALYKCKEQNVSYIPVVTLKIIGSNSNMNKDFRTETYFIKMNDYVVNIENLGVVIENLKKLNLISVDFMKSLANDKIYEDLIEDANAVYKPTFHELEMEFNCECNVAKKDNGIIFLTNIGQSLLDICLNRH